MKRQPENPEAIRHFTVTSQDQQAKEHLVDEVLAGFLQSMDEGNAPDPQQLIAKHPELEAELRAFFDGEKLFSQTTASVASAKLPTSIVIMQPSVSTIVEFGDYLLLDEIARGGMGIVYRARQKSLDRIVAVKLILGSGFATDREVRRFREEAKAAAQLVHSSIVRVLEVGEHEGQHYYSMEYLAGGSLADRLITGPVSSKQAAKWIRCIADAMHYAHQQGVLHRDIKPANVLLTDDDRPMLSDFGLAKRLHVDNGLTQSGEVLGTPSYMAPEQAGKDQRAIGTWSDVYSLGALLYALITGRPPIQAETPQAVIMALANEQPISPRHFDSKIHADLETICLKCLEKHPKDRYESAKELSEDLVRFLDGHPIRARRIAMPSRIAKWGRRNPMATIILAMTLLAIAAVPIVAHYFVKLDRQISMNEKEKTIAIKNKEQAEIRMSSAEQQVIEISGQLSSSEKAKRLAQDQATAQADFTARLSYVQRLNQAYEAWESGDGERTRRLLEQTRPEDGETDQRGFAWFHLYKKVHQIEREFVFEHGVSDSRISADGSRLAVLDGKGTVNLFNLENGEPIVPSSGNSLITLGQSSSTIEFSPDSTLLAVAIRGSGRNGSDHRKIFLQDAQNGSGRRYLEQPSEGELSRIMYLPDGETLIGLHADWVNIAAWNVDDGKLLYEVATDDTSLLDSAVSPNGLIVGTLTVSESDATWLRIRNAKNGNDIYSVRLPGRHFYGSLKFSPDGSTLAASVMDGDEQSTSCFVVWETQDWKQIGSINTVANDFFFSPDSATVAVGELTSTGRFSGALTIKLYDLESMQLIKEAVRESKRGFFMGYSGDGSSLYTISGRTFGDSQVKEWDVSSGRLLQKQNVALQTTTKLLPGGQTLLTEVSTPNLRNVISGDQTRKVRLRIMGQHAEQTKLPTNVESESNISFMADNTQLLVTGANESAAMNLTNGQVQTIPAGTGKIAPLANLELAFLLDNGQVQIRKLGTGNDRVAILTEGGIQFNQEVDGIWSSENGTALYIAAGGNLFRGNVQGGIIQLANLINNVDPKTQIVISRSGDRVVILESGQMGGQQEVAVYSGIDGTLVARLVFHVGQLHNTIFEFLSDRFLICRQLDSPVEIWDLAQIKKTTVLDDPAPALVASDIAGSPDGRILAVSNSLGAIQLWDIKTSTLLARLELDEIAQQVAFSPDGTRLAALCTDGVIRILHADAASE
jgi:serine/threonine protein kinase/WD40 repeat protein